MRPALFKVQSRPQTDAPSERLCCFFSNRMITILELRENYVKIEVC